MALLFALLLVVVQAAEGRSRSRGPVEESVLLPVPLGAAWNALTRQADIESWTGRNAEVELRAGGRLRLSAAVEQDKTTNRFAWRVLAVDPLALLALRLERVDGAEPDALDALKQTTLFLYFDAVSPEKTRLRRVVYSVGKSLLPEPVWPALEVVLWPPDLDRFSAYLRHRFERTRVEGRVVDGRGQPVGGVKIRLTQVYEDGYEDGLALRQELGAFRRSNRSTERSLGGCATDRRGRFAIRPMLDRGERLMLAAAKPGYGEYMTTEPVGSELTRLEIRMDRTYTIESVRRLLRLKGAKFRAALEECVTSSNWRSYQEIVPLLFANEPRVLPLLNELPAEPDRAHWGRLLRRLLDCDHEVPPRYELNHDPPPGKGTHPRLPKPSDSPSAMVIAGDTLEVARNQALLCLSPQGINAKDGVLALNPAGTKALVGAQVINGGLAARGYYLVFQRRDGRWVLMRLIEIWIS